MSKFIEKIKMFFKNTCKKIKVFWKTKIKPWLISKLKLIWERIKIFYKTKFLPWFKKNWFEIINLSILFIVHILIRKTPDAGFADFIIKTWILAIIIYYIWNKIKNYVIFNKKS